MDAGCGVCVAGSIEFPSLKRVTVFLFTLWILTQKGHHLARLRFTTKNDVPPKPIL